MLVADESYVATATGHVWHRRRGVSESALCAEQRGRGQRGQHGPGRGRSDAAAGQRQHAVGHPEGPAGCLIALQGAALAQVLLLLLHVPLATSFQFPVKVIFSLIQSN